MASTILHLIDGDGEFASDKEVNKFFNEVQFKKRNGDASDGSAAAAAVNTQTTAYHTLAVFGGQGTGKSTVLNALFGTKFSTMVEDGGRSQTTRGAFAALVNDAPGTTAAGDSPVQAEVDGASPDKPESGAMVTSSTSTSTNTSPNKKQQQQQHKGNLLLVLDFEGTDGLERGEDQSFERKLALFAVSCADVVIINMQSSEVNRFNAANLTLLRIVFELNLRLFQGKKQSPSPDARPILFFLIRDFVTGTLSKMSDVLTSSLEKTWANVAKPPEFADAKVLDFFELRFAALPHYQLQQDRWFLEASLLRGAFLEHADEMDTDDNDPSGSNSPLAMSESSADLSRSASTGLIMNAGASYIFEKRGRNSATAVPLMDNVLYFSNVWQTIKEQRDLDIPSQRLLVAKIRAQEAADEIFAAFTKEIRRVEEQLGAGVVPKSLAAKLEELNLNSAMQFRDMMTLYVDGSNALVQEKLEEMAARMQRATVAVFRQLAQCLARALLRSNESVVQMIVHTALSKELPKLAQKYLCGVEKAAKIAAAAAAAASSTAAVEQEDTKPKNPPSSAAAAAAAAVAASSSSSPSSNNTSTSAAIEAVRRQEAVEEQLKRIDAAPLVRSFWSFIISEIDGVVNDVRSKIQKVDVTAEQQQRQGAAAASSEGKRSEEAAILLAGDGTSNSTNTIVREIALAFSADPAAITLVLELLAAGLEDRVRQRFKSMTADTVSALNSQFDRTMQTNPETGSPRVFRNKEAMDEVHRQAQCEGFLLLNCLALMRGRCYPAMVRGGSGVGSTGTAEISSGNGEDSPTRAAALETRAEIVRTKIAQLCEKFDIRYVVSTSAALSSSVAKTNVTAVVVGASSSSSSSGDSNSTSSISADASNTSKHIIISKFSYPSKLLQQADEDEEKKSGNTVNRTEEQEGAALALRVFTENFLLLDEESFRHAFDLFQRDCSFKRLVQLQQLEANAVSGAHWAVYVALAFFVFKEVIAWMSDPVWLIIIVVGVVVFGREFIKNQYLEFLEAGPPHIVLPVKAAMDKLQGLIGPVTQ